MLRLCPNVESPLIDRLGGVSSLKLLEANCASSSFGLARGDRGGVRVLYEGECSG
jgi:hypothetical protein